jgi:HEAT repeat protein
MPALVKAFKNPDDKIRLAALRQASSLLQKPVGDISLVVPGLISLMRDPNPQIRFGAATLAGVVRPPRLELLPALVNLAQAQQGEFSIDSSLILQAVIHALGKLGDKSNSAVPTLTQLLAHPNPTIRERAALALWRIEHDLNRVLPALTALLRDGDICARQLGAAALLQISRDTDLEPELVAEITSILTPTNHPQQTANP